MNSSLAWKEFLEHLREITQLLRADPSSAYAARRTGSPSSNVDLTSAITKASMSLTSGRLQGCVASQVQEFLERLDSSGIAVDAIPDVLRAHLVLQYPRSQKSKIKHAIEVQVGSAPLWTSGTVVPLGTIKTSSLPDRVWNPWPDKVQELLGRCEINLYREIEQEHGSAYLRDLRVYVDGLVEFRNKVAHGDEPQPVSVGDVRRAMRWSIRLARASDTALARKLSSLTGQPAW